MYIQISHGTFWEYSSCAGCCCCFQCYIYIFYRFCSVCLLLSHLSHFSYCRFSLFIQRTVEIVIVYVLLHFRLSVCLVCNMKISVYRRFYRDKGINYSWYCTIAINKSDNYFLRTFLLLALVKLYNLFAFKKTLKYSVEERDALVMDEFWLPIQRKSRNDAFEWKYGVTLISEPS